MQRNLIPIGKTSKRRVIVKKPITNDEIDSLPDSPLDILTFQRIARKHYKTDRAGNILYVKCKLTQRCCIINFSRDPLGYMVVKFGHELFTFNTCAEITRDLFIKLRRAKLF